MIFIRSRSNIHLYGMGSSLTDERATLSGHNVYYIHGQFHIKSLNIKWIKLFFRNISQYSSNLPHSAFISIRPKPLIQQLLYPSKCHTLPWPFCLYHRQVRDRMELIFTVIFLLYCCLSFNRCHSLCLYCNMMGEFSITLSSLIGLWPCWWVRDEKEEEWEDPKSFYRV